MLAAPQARQAVDTLPLCRHCGDECQEGGVPSADGPFCCGGCEAVYAILKAHALEGFYGCDAAPGVSQRNVVPRDRARFAALDDPAVASRLIEFEDETSARVTFPVPAIHCASCVWLLEQFWRIDPGVVRAEVDLLRRTLHLEYRPASTSLRRIAEQLSALGYEPAITHEGVPPAVSPHRRLYLKLGVAGFAFGNIMLFSIPRYANGAPLEDGFQRLFDVLNVLFALPVLLFSASDFFRTAWLAVRNRTMVLEVPLAIGLGVLFGRSIVEIGTGRGEGFLDSFVGLTFFLLIARLFQQKVFDGIAFDRTFRSFLPLSVQVDRHGEWHAVPVDDLHAGDRIAVRPHEVVPADAVLLDEAGEIDYAFTTGEQRPVAVSRGETIRAGGRVAGRTLELRVLRDVSHSQLARLWNNPVFSKPKTRWLTEVAARFGAWFTAGALGLAALGAFAWWPDVAASASVATAVLIIACPCALTLSAPITLGTAMGLLGRRGLYLKHPAVALDLSRIDTVAFDKTGTLTTPGARAEVEHHGLSDNGLALVRRLASESVHPVSRALARELARASSRVPRAASHAHVPAPGAPLPASSPQPLTADAPRLALAGLSTSDAEAVTPMPLARSASGDDIAGSGLARPRHVLEVVGQGLAATIDGQRVAIGTADFVQAQTGWSAAGPQGCTYVAAGDERGWIRLSAGARAGIDAAAGALAAAHDIHLLSGDHDTEGPRWAGLFGARMRFRQSPEDKLAYIRTAQADGRHVLMVGDGLNDAGALAAADVGMSVADETACIAPACDAVISGSRLVDLPAFIRYARRARHVVVLCFVVSILYNVAGLTLALAGALTPLAAAILMPVSSLTIVGISTGAMRWAARRMLPA